MELLDLITNQDIFSQTVELSHKTDISITMYNETVQNFSDFDVFIIGYREDRNSNSVGAKDASREIRTQIYSLYSTSNNCSILDFGDCKLGLSVQDSYVILQETIAILSKYNKPIIVFGGTQEAVTYVSNTVFVEESYPSITCIDSQIDYHSNEEDFANEHFLHVVHHSFPQARISIIGFQEYLNSKATQEWMKQNYFPIYRLGDVYTSILGAEPLIRDAQIVSFDMSALKNSDCFAQAKQNPIGLTAKDACQLAWYAGYSTNMKVFMLSELNPKLDNSAISAKLSAQILWHVIDGISQRKGDFPVFSPEFYKCYYVKSSLFDADLVFYENFISNYFWSELPLQNSNAKRVLPCLHSDYQDFMLGFVPDVWMIEFNRMCKNK